MSKIQTTFDGQYISSSEIMKELNVSRTAIFTARHTGRLPEAIDIQGKIFLWERDKIRPYIEAWKKMLNARRGTA